MRRRGVGWLCAVFGWGWVDIVGSWSAEELAAMGAAEEIELRALSKDGTLGRPVAIWFVRVGDDLYVRAYRGRRSVWLRRAHASGRGQVRVGGVAKDVVFEDVGDELLNLKIDLAYQLKYRRYGGRYVDAMITPQTRETTIRIVPAH